MKKAQVMWSEGMFMMPQHFQQQTRFHTWQSEQMVQALSPFAWGVRELLIDTPHLQRGEFVVTQFAGILPSGTWISLDPQEAKPLRLELRDVVLPTNVYIGQLKSFSSQKDGDPEAENAFGQYRYRTERVATRDCFSQQNSEAEVILAVPNLVLKTDQEDLSDYDVLPIAQVTAISLQGAITLDENFIPPLLSLQGSATLLEWIKDIHHWLLKRRDKILNRLVGVSHSGVANVNELLFLQLLNRYQPLLNQYQSNELTSPWAVYQVLVQMMGELATFTHPTRYYPENRVYQHRHLTQSFAGLKQDIQTALNYMFEEAATRIPLNQEQYGLLVAQIDKSVFQTYKRFIVAITGNLEQARLTEQVPKHLKIGSGHRIRDMVNLHIPGVKLHLVAQAPREIPFQSDRLYFELETSSPRWQEIVATGSLVMHLGCDISGFQANLWAIKTS